MPNISPEIISVASASAAYIGVRYLNREAEEEGAAKDARLEVEAATIALESDTTPSHEVSRMQRILGRKAMRPVVIGAASIAGLAGYATGVYFDKDTERSVTEQAPGATRVIADATGATRFSFNDNPPSALQVRGLVSEFDSDAEILMARDGKITAVDAEEFDEFTPFGNADLALATRSAVSNIEGANGNVVVITNGNTLNVDQELINRAKQSNTKVSVVNVEQDNENSLKAEQNLAKRTGGKYWDVNQDNLSDVAEQVQEMVEPPKVESNEGLPWSLWPVPLFVVMGAASIKGILRDTRKNAITRKSPKGE